MKMIKIFLTVIPALFITFSVQADNSFQKIKIGISTALSGDAASYGTDVKNFSLFANQELANNKYQFVIEDDKCLPKDGVTVAQKLINQDKVKYVLGTCSSTVISSGPLYNRSAVINISSFASAPKISDLGKYTFRTFPSDAVASRVLAEYIRAKHQKIAMISAETDYAQGFAEAFLKHKGDLEIYSDNYIEGNTDFRSLISKVISKNVEAVFVNSQTPAAYMELLKTIKKFKPEMQIYSAYWPAVKLVRDQVPQQNEGAIYVELEQLDTKLNAESANLRKKFEQQFGKLNTFESVFYVSFEAFRAIHLAIEAEAKGQDPLEFLNTHKFKGVFGEWSFDKNSDIQGLGFTLMQIKDGKVLPLKN